MKYLFKPFSMSERHDREAASKAAHLQMAIDRKLSRVEYFRQRLARQGFVTCAGCQMLSIDTEALKRPEDFSYELNARAYCKRRPYTACMAADTPNAETHLDEIPAESASVECQTIGASSDRIPVVNVVDGMKEAKSPCFGCPHVTTDQGQVTAFCGRDEEAVCPSPLRYEENRQALEAIERQELVEIEDEIESLLVTESNPLAGSF